MKFLTTAFLTFLMGAAIPFAKGQGPGRWVEVSPGDDLFRVLMPQKPELENQKARYGGLIVSGRAYTASVDDTGYVVWSFVNTDFSRQPFQDSSAYLDACADLVWEALLKSARDKLPNDKRMRARMTYGSEVSDGPLPGRQYLIVLGDMSGATRIYIEDARIYVLVVLGPPGVWKAEAFFKSFNINPRPDVPARRYGDPIGIGTGVRGGDRDDETDYNRVFGGRDTTEKARILAKPEPTYTESARKYGVQGTVILRVVFSKEGQVTNIHILTRLPHGLTEQALAAARQIRFAPALKDGRPVSMYMQLEYNFNLY